MSAVSRSAECMSNKIRNIENLKSAFSQSFDTLGNFKEEYHLTVGPAIAPGVHPCSKYAIQRREAIQNELKKMEVMGVIVKETEPTDWVSRLTFTEKRDGTLRLCLDQRVSSAPAAPPLQITSLYMVAPRKNMTITT